MTNGRKHIVIPDVQLRPGDSTNFLRRIGQYIVEKKPDVVVCIGDFADMPSLSSYDVGKKSFEGRRYKADIEAVHEGMEALLGPLTEYNAGRRRAHRERYVPDLVLTLGNHEHRINRVVEGDPKLDGTISIEDLKYKQYGWRTFDFLEPVVIDDVAYCLHGSHCVYTADLRAVPLFEVEVGTKIIAFDEHNAGSGRKYKTGTILKKTITPAITYDVTLSNGKVFTCTGDHRWLARKPKVGAVWMHTHELSGGTIIPRYFGEFNQDVSYSAGWLGGVLDGEGWLSQSNINQGGIQLGIAQNEGIVLDKIKSTLDMFEVQHHQNDSTNSKCKKVQVLAPSAEKLRLLARVRPERLIAKFQPEMLGRMQALEYVTVVSVELSGIQDIVQIETDTATLIVDGYAHHNCHYFVTGVMGRPCTTAAAQLTKKHMSCIAGHQQGLQISTGHRADGLRLTSVIAGSCLTPDHKVLTADLRYVPIGDLQEGDKLVSFDEEVVDKRSRRYKTGVVERLKRSVKEVFEVELDSGKKFKVTADHRWLVKTGSKYYWKTTNKLRKGTCVPKLFDEWECQTSKTAGWLEGMYDGEGSLSQRKTTGGTTMQLAIAQNEGPVLDRLRFVLESSYGQTVTYTPNGRKCKQLRLQGGTTSIAKFLGSIRPNRLLSKFKPEFLGRINSPDENNSKIVSIKKLGPQEIVEIEIDAKTMIVEGYPHHNCYEHNEDYMGPQGNKHWRGILVLHEVKNGEFDLMPVSLSYLEKKYG